jgi:glycosyltransferase involved in cell wall biosynthesis
MRKLIVGITAPGSVILIEGQLKYFKEQGYKTYLLAPKNQRVLDYCELEGCELLPVDIEREISLFKDLKALIKIVIHFAKVRPDVINFGTPKVSLLGMFAGKLLGVKNRIYTCRGFRFEHEVGNKKAILLLMEKWTAKWSHKIICISESVRQLGIENNLFPFNKTTVINKGSSNGFDLKKFNPNSISDDLKIKQLTELGYTKENFVYGFVGRLVDRKGIKELYFAFNELYKTNNYLRLLIVGPIEFAQISDLSLIDKYKTHQGIKMVGSQTNVPLFLSLMDVFILPAWWEGFGNVSVQAAAMGLPVISTDVTGSRDAVCKDFNALLIESKSIDKLQEAMELLNIDEELRTKLGENGLVWAKNFDNNIIWEGMNKIYES